MNKRLINSVEAFKYNGFFVQSEGKLTNYQVKELIEWTNDPGIGKFNCSDGKIRLIPTCQLTEEFMKTVKPQPELAPNLIGGRGDIFGQPSKS